VPSKAASPSVNSMCLLSVASRSLTEIHAVSCLGRGYGTAATLSAACHTTSYSRCVGVRGDGVGRLQRSRHAAGPRGRCYRVRRTGPPRAPALAIKKPGIRKRLISCSMEDRREDVQQMKRVICDLPRALRQSANSLLPPIFYLPIPQISVSSMKKKCTACCRALLASAVAGEATDQCTA
jgi:hypothetical protein